MSVNKRLLLNCKLKVYISHTISVPFKELAVFALHRNNHVLFSRNLNSVNGSNYAKLYVQEQNIEIAFCKFSCEACVPQLGSMFIFMD